MVTKTERELLADAWDTIETLRKENERLIEALKLAKEKLIIYRNNSKGDYLGGVEYVNLISIIEQALNREPGV